MYTDSGATGRFTAELSRRALGVVCSRIGLDDRDAEPIKLTVNAVYRLPREDAVVRIAGSAAMAHRVGKVVRVAQWLAEHEMPAVRLFPGVPAPVAVDGHLATVWVDAAPTGGVPRPRADGTARSPGRPGQPPDPLPGAPPDPSPGPPRGPLPGPLRARDLAAILRRLHALPPPDPPLPVWDPLDDVRRRLSDAEGLGEDDRGFLEELAVQVEEALAGVRYALPRVVVHGDAHLGNLVRSAGGEVVVCDFDATCLGPAEWDLVPVAVGTLRFGRPPQPQAELAGAYGFDVTAWEGFGVLRAVRELKLVTSVVPILASNPSAAAQFGVRLASLRSRSDAAIWTPYR